MLYSATLFSVFWSIIFIFPVFFSYKKNVINYCKTEDSIYQRFINEKLHG
jgi:hypothetical protein